MAARSPFKRRALAVAIALGLHALLALALAESVRAPSRYLREYSGDGAVAVLVVGPTAKSASSQMPSFEDLRQTAAQNWLAPQSSVKPTALSEIWGDDRAASAVQTGAAANEGQGFGRVSSPASQVSLPRSHSAPRDASGKVAPCWLRTEEPVAAVVRLVLGEDGGVIGPPKFVKRPAEAAAEQAVLRALADCAPYGIATKAGAYPVIELDFARREDWVRQVGTMEFR